VAKDCWQQREQLLLLLLPVHRVSGDTNICIMGDREDSVYKAKLAEQAERYDGRWMARRAS